MRLIRSALIVVGAPLLATVAGCSHQASAGSLVDKAGPGSTSGQALHLRAPSGTFTVTLGTPLTHLAADDTADGSSGDAPDGGRYVPVTWSFEPAAVSVVDTSAHQTALALSAGGTTYAVGTVDRTSTPAHSVYVAVADPHDLGATVTFDGRTATATADGGRGDVALGDSGRQVGVPCHAPSGLSNATCTVRAYRTQWAGRWAPHGRHFEVVDAELSLGNQAVRAGGSTTYYQPAAGSLRVTLQGRSTPTSLPQDPQGLCHFRGRTTLETTLDHPLLSLALTCSMDRAGSDGPARGDAHRRYRAIFTARLR